MKKTTEMLTATLPLSLFTAVTFFFLFVSISASLVISTVKTNAVVKAAEFGVFNDRFCRVGLLEKATDQTLFLRRALATTVGGQRLVLPKAAEICLNSPGSTLRINKPVLIDMNGATIRWNAPSGTPVAPILDFLPAADGFELMGDGQFDGQNDRIAYRDSDYIGKGPYRGGGDALVSVQANGTVVNIKARAAFDSCIQIAAFDPMGIIQAGRPEHGSVANVKTMGCGVGEHGTLQGEGGPGKGGAGVNNGSGANWRFTDLLDESSYEGFGCDVGAGAGCHLHGFKGTMTSFDARYPAGPTGNCLYNGARSATFESVRCIAPGLRGLSSDGGAAYARYSDIFVYSPARECVEIKGNSIWKNLVCVKANDSAAIVINNLQPHSITVALQNIKIWERGPRSGAQKVGLMVEGKSSIVGTAEVVDSVGFSNLAKVSTSVGQNFRIIEPAHGSGQIEGGPR